MCPDENLETARRDNSVAVDWHDCAWQPQITVQPLPDRRQTKPLPVTPSILHNGRCHPIYPKTMKNNLLSSRRLRAGFTLIELLVVISIIAILAAMLLPVLNRVKISTQKAKAKLEAQDILTAIQHYDSAYGRFPVSSVAQNAAGSGDFTYGGAFQDAGGNTFLLGTPTSPTTVLTNSEVVAILMDYTNYPDGSGSTINTNFQKNPQQTIFLNAKMSGWEPSMGGQPEPGVGTDLVYRDPWGNPYIITIDLNYDEQCSDAFYCLQSVSQVQPPNLPAYGQSGYNGLFNPNSSATTLPQKNNFLFHGKVMVWSAGPPTANGKPVVDINSSAVSSANKNHVLSWQ